MLTVLLTYWQKIWPWWQYCGLYWSCISASQRWSLPQWTCTRYCEENEGENHLELKVNSFLLIWILVHWKFQQLFVALIFLVPLLCYSFMQSLLHVFKEDPHTYILCMGWESSPRSLSLSLQKKEKKSLSCTFNLFYKIWVLVKVV